MQGRPKKSASHYQSLVVMHFQPASAYTSIYEGYSYACLDAAWTACLSVCVGHTGETRKNDYTGQNTIGGWGQICVGPRNHALFWHTSKTWQIPLNICWLHQTADTASSTNWWQVRSPAIFLGMSSCSTGKQMDESLGHCIMHTAIYNDRIKKDLRIHLFWQLWTSFEANATAAF